MKHVIIGTAGHVDHGKTSLIRALTGTDTDRLKEEQERGMTIDLGFAALKLPNGDMAGIVDVPGHERFLKNMLAGAGGVDVALLVVAADEGVMPQTIEHAEILDLLAVKCGVVALSKADLVDEEWLRLVQDEVRGLLEGTSLAGAPVVVVDALSGRGLDDLVDALAHAVSQVEPRDVDAPFRLPVDRVFTMPGFGPVVTGTIIAGTLRVGDAAEVLPKGLAVRVRGLQSHGQPVDRVEAGMRAAVNLAGAEAKDLARGDVLAAPGVLKPTRVFDASVRMLNRTPLSSGNAQAGKPLETGARVRLHLGTAEVLARVQVLGDRRIEPGHVGFVRFRCERDAAVLRGDRFILRTYSPMVTVAGGVVLDANPSLARRAEASIVRSLRILEAGSLQQIVGDWLMRQAAPVSIDEIARGVAAPEEAVRSALRDLAEAGQVELLAPDVAVHREVLQRLTQRAQELLEAYHSTHPLHAGMGRQELRSSLARNMDPRCFAALLQHWHQAGILSVLPGSSAQAGAPAAVRLPGFTIRFTPEQAQLAERIQEALGEARLGVASVEELRKSTGAAMEAIQPVLRALAEEGMVLQVAEGLYAHRHGIEQARLLVEDLIRRNGSVTVAQLRDASGSSRRYALALLEYLDRAGVTARRGDARVLADNSDAGKGRP